MNKSDELVLKILKESNKPLTRMEIAEKANLAITTTYDALVRLVREGLVRRTKETQRKTRGRPKIYFEAI